MPEPVPRPPPPTRAPAPLRLPAAAVEHLVRLGLRTQPGEQWWAGFACAHGEPGWLQPGAWRLVVPDATLLPAAREGAGGAGGAGGEEP